MRKDEFEDDGRTIADMSGIDRPSMFLPKGSFKKKNERPLDLYEDKERFWIIMGTLKATLMIASAYIIGIGAIVLAMYLFFKSKM